MRIFFRLFGNLGDCKSRSYTQTTGLLEKLVSTPSSSVLSKPREKLFSSPSSSVLSKPRSSITNIFGSIRHFFSSSSTDYTLFVKPKTYFHKHEYVNGDNIRNVYLHNKSYPLFSGRNFPRVFEINEEWSILVLHEYECGPYLRVLTGSIPVFSPLDYGNEIQGFEVSKPSFWHPPLTPSAAAARHIVVCRAPRPNWKRLACDASKTKYRTGLGFLVKDDQKEALVCVMIMLLHIPEETVQFNETMAFAYAVEFVNSTDFPLELSSDCRFAVDLISHIDYRRYWCRGDFRGLEMLMIQHRLGDYYELYKEIMRRIGNHLAKAYLPWSAFHCSYMPREANMSGDWAAKAMRSHGVLVCSPDNGVKTLNRSAISDLLAYILWREKTVGFIRML